MVLEAVETEAGRWELRDVDRCVAPQAKSEAESNAPIAPTRFRKLRIAFSATCLVVCVLLIALWMRSYWSLDSIETKFGIVGSVYGRIVAYTEIYLPPTGTREWLFESTTTPTPSVSNEPLSEEASNG